MFMATTTTGFEKLVKKCGKLRAKLFYQLDGVRQKKRITLLQMFIKRVFQQAKNYFKVPLCVYDLYIYFVEHSYTKISHADLNPLK
jgi:hypothetical protein